MVVINCAIKELKKTGFSSLKNWLDSDPNNVYIGRSDKMEGAVKSKWSNPFPISKYGREKGVELYKQHVLTTPELFNSLSELKNKNFACWCSPNVCHGHTLEELSNMTKTQLLTERSKYETVETTVETVEPKIKSNSKVVKKNIIDKSWENKLKKMNKDNLDLEERLNEAEAEKIRNEEKQVNYVKERIETNINKQKKKEEDKKNYDEFFKQTSNVAEISHQIQREPIDSVKITDKISKIVYDKIISKVPGMEASTAEKYAHVITNITLYNVKYQDNLMKEVESIINLLRD